MSNNTTGLPDTVQVYLVGGAVRDKLLGLAVTDRDYVVVGATPELMTEYGFKPVGQDFPVFLHPHNGEEYALARTERKTGQGYHGFSVSFDPDVSLEDDLFRRDLTINAMAQAITPLGADKSENDGDIVSDGDGDIIDPYHGQRDIHLKLLRHVSAAFSEDPLRVLRLLRFHAKLAPLGFSIDKQTWQLAQGMVNDGELDHLTAERVWIEVSKALATDAPWVFWQDLYELKALTVLGFDDNLPRTTFNAMQANLQQVCQCSNLAAIRLAAWLEPYPGGGKKATQVLPLPRHDQYWIALFVNHANTLRHWSQATPQAKWQLFKQSGSLRGQGDIVRFAHALAIDETFIADILRKQSQLHQIDPQFFIAQGLQGQALGEAIKTAQLDQLQSAGGQA